MVYDDFNEIGRFARDEQMYTGSKVETQVRRAQDEKILDDVVRDVERDMGSKPKTKKPKTKPITASTILKFKDVLSAYKGFSQEGLENYLKERVVGQDSAIAVIASAFWREYLRVGANTKEGDEIDKVNVLFMGPSGSGKTYTAELALEYLRMPFGKSVVSNVSPTGYIGGGMTSQLINSFDSDVAARNLDPNMIPFGKGYFDEIDKLGSQLETRKALVDELIGMITGGFLYRAGKGQDKDASIPTKNMQFILSGAFYDLIPIVKKRLSPKADGFSNEQILKQANTQDFKDFGYKHELMGRLQKKAVFRELNEKDLTYILSGKKGCLVEQHQRLMHEDGVNVDYDPAALAMVVKLAIAERTGARGLDEGMETLMEPFYLSTGKKYVKSNGGLYISKELAEKNLGNKMKARELNEKENDISTWHRWNN